MQTAQRQAACDARISQTATAGLRNCAAIDLGLLRGAPEGMGAIALESAEQLVPADELVVPARRLIVRERDALESIPLICAGWAACSVTLFDGRRQILGFLLPGDIAPTAAVFGEVAQFSVEAVTDVHYRAIARTQFKAALMRDAGLFDTFCRLWADEKFRADQLAVDLGRRSADERIARLILRLAEQMKRRGLADGDGFEFPLRQHHIADATGLTAVHVSKVLTEFRRSGYIELNDRALTIANLAGFRAIANMR